MQIQLNWVKKYASIALICAAFSTAQAQRTVTFELWNWLPEYEKQFWDKAADQFNAARKEAKIKMSYQGVGFNELPQQFLSTMQQSPKAGPDILTIEFNQWMFYTANKATGFLTDLSMMTNKPNAPFSAAFQEEYALGKQKYAVSFQASPLIFAYNHAKWSEIGIEGPIKTWEEFATAAETAHKKGKVLALIDVYDFQIWYGLFLQRGGAVADATGKSVLTAHFEDAVSVLDLLKRLQRAGVRDYSLPGFVSGNFVKDFHSGKLMGVVAGDWILPILKQQIPNQAGVWKLQPVPGWDKGHKGVATGGTGYAISVKPGRTPEDQKLLRDFVEFAVLSTQMQALYYKENMLQMTNLQIINNRAVITLEDPFFGGQKPAAELREEIKDLAVRRLSLKQSELVKTFTAEIGNFYDGKISSADFFLKMTKAIQ